MTHAQRMKAIKDALAVDETSNWGTAELTAILKGLEVLRSVASGEMVIVPAEPTEGMIAAANGAMWRDWPMRAVLISAIKQYKEQG